MYNEKVYSGNISATYNYKITKRFFLIMAYVLFFMMLFVPTTYQPVKAVLLFMVLSGITLSTIARGRITLHPQILLWTLLMMTVGLSFMFWGFINYAPGALRVGTVHLLWPFVYTMLVAGAVSERVLTGLLKVLVLATIAIGLYGLSFILYAYGWLPEILYIPIDQGQAIGFYQGFVEFNLYSLASLLFLVPFIVGCLLVWSKNDAMPISRLWLWIALFLGLLLVLLSGRRALLLVVAVSPFIALILRSFLPAEIKHKNRKSVLRLILGSGVMLACLGVYLQLTHGFQWQVFFEMFMSGFDFLYDPSAYARYEQFFALLTGWAASPLFGAGLGAAAEGSLRCVEMPWAFELYFLSLLFHMGIVGLSFYIAATIWIFWMSLKIIRSGDRVGLYLLPVLVGVISFLIASNTNPYLGKFDYIWVIFLPVAFINYWLLTRRKKRSSNLNKLEDKL